MAYTPLDVTKPDETTQGITAFSSSVRTNDEAILDQLVSGGSMPGWDYAVTAGTTDAPTEIVLTKTDDSNRKIRITYTYSGGLVATMKAAKTTNGGSNWDKITYAGKDLCTLTYDGNGFLQSTAWSVS
jgi:hypothetical protein